MTDRREGATDFGKHRKNFDGALHTVCTITLDLYYPPSYTIIIIIHESVRAVNPLAPA